MSGTVEYRRQTSVSKVEPIYGIEELHDGHTVVWLEHDTLLTESGGAVSAWEDIANGYVLLPIAADGSAGTSDNYPSWTEAGGVVFDGTNDAMRVEIPAWTSMTGTIYAVVKVVTYSYGKALFGYSGSGGQTIVQRSTTEIRDTRASGNSANLSGLSIGSFQIIMLSLDQSTPISYLSINNGTPVSNSSHMTGYVSGGVLLGAQRSTYPAVQLWSNVAFKAIIYRDQVDSGDTLTAIYNYLDTKYL